MRLLITAHRVTARSSPVLLFSPQAIVEQGTSTKLTHSSLSYSTQAIIEQGTSIKLTRSIHERNAGYQQKAHPRFLSSDQFRVLASSSSIQYTKQVYYKCRVPAESPPTFFIKQSIQSTSIKLTRVSYIPSPSYTTICVIPSVTMLLSSQWLRCSPLSYSPEGDKRHSCFSVWFDGGIMVLQVNRKTEGTYISERISPD